MGEHTESICFGAVLLIAGYVLFALGNGNGEPAESKLGSFQSLQVKKEHRFPKTDAEFAHAHPRKKQVAPPVRHPVASNRQPNSPIKARKLPAVAQRPVKKLPVAVAKLPRRLPEKKTVRPLGFSQPVVQASYSRPKNLPVVTRPVSKQYDTSIPDTRQVPILTSRPAVEAKAIERVSYGKSLARRGAFFAAKEEFLRSLYLVAEAYDRQSGSMNYSRRLKAGLRALEEANDFESFSSQNDSLQARTFVLESHSTKLVHPVDAGRFASDQFVETYCRYAKSQIEQALGRSPAASEGLFAYAKILVAERKVGVNKKLIDPQVAWTLFWVSATANPLNHQSVNQLGVGYLESGRLNKAGDMFLRAVKVSNGAVYWRNLAEVHLRLAKASRSAQERESQMILADQAMQEAKAVPPTPKSQQSENWVSAEQFVEHAAMPDSRIGLAAPPRNDNSLPAPVSENSRNENERALFKNLKKWF